MPSLRPNNNEPYSITDNFRNYFPQLLAYDRDRKISAKKRDNMKAAFEDSWIQNLLSIFKFFILLIISSMILYSWEYILLYLVYNNYNRYENNHLYYVYCVGIMIIQSLFICIFNHMSFTLIIKALIVNDNKSGNKNEGSASKLRAQCLIFTISIVINLIIGGISYILIIIFKHDTNNSTDLIHTILLNPIITNNTDSILCSEIIHCEALPILSTLLTFIAYPFGFGLLSTLIVHISIIIVYRKYNDKTSSNKPKQELQQPLITDSNNNENSLIELENVNDDAETECKVSDIIMPPNESNMDNFDSKSSADVMVVEHSKTRSIFTSTHSHSSNMSNLINISNISNISDISKSDPNYPNETRQDRIKRKKKEKREREKKKRYKHLYNDEQEAEQRKEIERKEKRNLKHASFEWVVIKCFLYHVLLFIVFIISAILMVMLSNISLTMINNNYSIYYYGILLIITMFTRLSLKYIGNKIDIVRVWMYLRGNKKENVSRPMVSTEVLMQLISDCVYWYGFRYLIMIHTVNHRIYQFIVILLLHLGTISYNGYIKMTKIYYDKIVDKLAYRVIADDSTLNQWRIRLSIDLMVGLLVCLYSGIHWTVKILCYGRNAMYSQVLNTDDITTINYNELSVDGVWQTVNIYNIITLGSEFIFYCLLISYQWFKNEWNVGRYIDIQYRARRYSYVALFVVTVIWVEFFF